MRQISFIRIELLLLLLQLLTVGDAMAVMPSLKLLSLVPPGAGVVAGMFAPTRSGQPASFLLATPNNIADLNDFISLSGVDEAHFMNQILLVESNGNTGPLSEHSLLAAGRFNQKLIYGAALRSASGADGITYHGIPVLIVQPFNRERDTLSESRWLVVTDSGIAIFGTAFIVQVELNRYLGHALPDFSLVEKLARLRRDDDTWCTATIHKQSQNIQSVFELLDSRLTGLLRAGDTIQFGIHYGRQVEFEYEIVATSSKSPMRAGEGDEIGHLPKSSSLLPGAELAGVPSKMRGVLKLSKAQYKTWLSNQNGISHRQ